jgi:DNA-binding SARP family transcriptional activator/tetratricopeptide (TPR) repeat protein
VEFGVLGPVEVRVAGQVADAGHPRQRAVLAVLLLDLGRVVPTELLIDRVWGGDPPTSVRNVLYGYVGRLRAVIADATDPEATLARRRGGYVLQARPGQLDLHRFRGLIAQAAAACDEDEHTAGLLREALGLWRGSALAGLDSPWLRGMRDMLELERAAAILDLNDIRLRQGQHDALISGLAGQAAASPANERLIGQLMLALYRSGQQAGALRWYEQTRQHLADEFGADPGPQLQALHQQILRADRSLTAPEPALLSLGAEPGAELCELHRQLLTGDPGSPAPDPASPAVAGGPGEMFIGRTDELTALEAAAATARAGRPAVVLVEGEAGIGKSTLLSRFASGLADAMVLRASGDEAERLLSYGIVSQLTSGAGRSGDLPGLLASSLNDAVDPIAVGSDVVAWLGQQSRGHRLVLGIIDDLQWADGPSARALLFALRRLPTARVLIVVSVRTAELARLGPGWQRFLAGDHRVARVRLRGFTPAEVVQLGQALGRGELSRPAVKRLIAETGGHPLYCRAVLEEAGTDDQRGESLPVPSSLAGVVLGRVSALSPAARTLTTAVAVLGTRCRLAVAARLAELEDPVPALGEAVAAGILTEQPDGAGIGIGFTHPLVQRVIYGDLSPERRRRLHIRAAGLVDRRAALQLRVGAAAGPDDQLAAELEAAAWDARRLGRLAEAAAWLAQAAEVSTDQEAAGHRLLWALEILLSFGEVAGAENLAAQIGTAGPRARRSWLLGVLDLLAGRIATAEERLAEAWRTHDRDREARVGCVAATWLTLLCLCAGRIREAVDWGERAAASPAAVAAHHSALSVLAMSLFYAGRGPEGLARLAEFADAPADVPLEDTDTLVLRGIARRLLEELPDAIADFSVAAARLQAGVPLRSASWCLWQLAGAEYRTGSWDDAVQHAEMAVSLASDADRTWDLGYAHSVAAVVRAQRGEWEPAGAHVRLAREAANAVGDVGAIGATSIAQQFLAMARGDLEGVIAAAAGTRASGRKEFFGIAGTYDWRCLEIEALIRLGRLSEAEAALAEMETDLSVFGPAAARTAAATLRADLALAAGRTVAATADILDAWHHAQNLQAPLLLAQLEITEARQLRQAGEPAAAIARLASARQRLSRLGAIPHLHACDRELAAATAAARSPVPHLTDAIDV